MKSKVTLVDVEAANLHTLPCCGIKRSGHEGRERKLCWWKRNLARGARAKVLLTPDGRQCGYIEYVPGEHAWRAVNARGYLFIHCIWTFYRQYQGKGHAAAMVEACVKDAKAAGMTGVAVVAREAPWLAGSDLFLKHGFTIVESAPPDYQLLVRKLDPAAPNPSFRAGREKKLKAYGRGLTIVRADQCPHAVRMAAEVAKVAREYKLRPRIVELTSSRQAQHAPTPYAAFAVVYDGRLLADHQVSATRFRNILRGEGIGPATRASGR